MIVVNAEIVEVRCVKCNKLLGKIYGKAEIQCPRCKKINKINTLEHLESAN